MATKQEFKTYMEQNKANLNQEALRGADMNMVYNEWRDTGSISKNYLNQPVTQQPVTQVTQQPNTQVQTQVQPNTQVQPQVEQQITPQVEQKQPLQTTLSKTQPGGTSMTQDNITTNLLVDEGKLPESQREIYPQKEVKPGEAPTLETPKYQQQLDKFLETSDFASARNKLKEGLANGTIDKSTFDKAESYIWGKIQEQSQVGRDENAMFNALKTGQKIQSQFTNTPEAKKAQSRYDVANRYSSMSEEQLYNAYLNGEIGSQLEKDIADNPYLSIAKERFNKKLVTDNINKEANNILNAYNKGIGKDIVKKEEKTALETINDRLLTMFENMGKSENEILDFKSYMAQNYPDLVNETKELNAKNMQLKNLVDERDARLDEIIKENPGISINRATMLASRQNKDINKQIQSMSYEIANLSANIQYQTSMADKEFGYALQQQSRQDQLAQEQRGYMFDFLKGEQAYQRGLEAEARQREYQLEDRQYQEELQQRQLEQKYAYEYGDLNSDNPTLQNIAIERVVASMYENYPIPGMESQSVKVQKVKNLMAQGMTGTEAIAQVESEIRNSQRYKDYLASEKAKITPKTTQSYELKEVGGKTYRFNQSTGEYEVLDGGTPTNVSVTPSGNYANITYTMSSGTKKPIKVDSVAKDDLMNALNSIGKGLIVGDSFRDSARQEALYKELSAKGATVAKPGTSKHEKGLAVDIYSGKNSKGQLLAPTKEQVAIMNANGWFQTAGEDDKGHFEYLGKQAQPTYSQQADAWANNIMNGKAKLSDLTGKENIPLKNQVIQIMNQKSGGSTGKTQDNLELGLQIVSSLINHPGRQSATGVPNFFTNPFGYALPTSNARDFQATLKQFSDLQFLNAVPQMQGMGALSNAEGLKLSGALTKLQDTGISEEDFLKELNRVKEVMNKAYKNITGNDYGQVNTTGISTQTNTQQSNNASNYLKSLGY